MTLNSNDIRVGSFEEAAAQATGTAVVIDVFRAFTTAAVAVSNGVDTILMTGSIDDALALRADGAGAFCMGERNGLRPDGFDFGNSPAELSSHLLDGQIAIQTTSNGTRGILAATGAQQIFAGALVTARATADVILANPILPISLVAMGDANGMVRDEDEICALYLRSLLTGKCPNKEAVARSIRSMADLRDTRQLSDADVDACLAIDSVNFAIQVTRSGERALAKPLRP